MFQKEIPTIFMESRDWHKSRNDRNQKEVIIDQRCLFPCLNSMKEAR